MVKPSCFNLCCRLCRPWAPALKVRLLYQGTGVIRNTTRCNKNVAVVNAQALNDHFCMNPIGGHWDAES